MPILAGSIAGRALAGASRIGITKSSVQKKTKGSGPPGLGRETEDVSEVQFEGFTQGAKLAAAYGTYEAQKGGRKVASRARRKYF